MGPEEFVISRGKFTERIPPAFDGHVCYNAYKTDVLLWCKLTSLDEAKQGPALVGQLSGEAKNSAKNLTVETLCSSSGVTSLLSHLDESFAIDESDRLDEDLADFLCYTWDKTTKIEQYIVGFHARLDKIAEVNLTDKVKGHIMLRQASLEPHERSLIVGAASGRFDIKHISNALRTTYRDPDSKQSTMATRASHRQNTARPPNELNTNRALEEPRNTGSRTKTRSTHRLNAPAASAPQHRPSFVSAPSPSPGRDDGHAIIDTGACASIVGQDTLNRFMKNAKLRRLPNARKTQSSHRFGQHKIEHQTLCAVKVPFEPTVQNSKERSLGFDVSFDVIAGNLPFLLGLPSLNSMNATISLAHMNIGIWLNQSYCRLAVATSGDHICLPLRPRLVQHKSAKDYSTTPATPGDGSGISWYTPYPTPSMESHDTIHSASDATHPSDNSPQHSYSNEDIDDQRRRKSTKALGFYSIDSAQGARTVKTPVGDYRPSSPKLVHPSMLQPPRSIEKPPPYSPKLSVMVDKPKLIKLHQQLRHASSSDMISYLKAANSWNDDLKPVLEEVLRECKCLSVSPKPPHPSSSVHPPPSNCHHDIALDIVHLGGRNYLHILDRATGWSEVAFLRSKNLQVQAKIFHLCYTLRHGPPVTIMGDQEYNKSAFLSYCSSIGSKFLPVAANAHQSNGAIERSNRTLRSFFNRLKATKSHISIDEIVAEATYGKNICRGAKIASSYELLYSHPPRVLDEIPTTSPKSPTVADQAHHAASARLQRLLRSPVRTVDQIKERDSVIFWRDDNGWLGPATVETVRQTDVTVRHNGRLKTCGRAYVKRCNYDPTRTDAPHDAPVASNLDNPTDSNVELDACNSTTVSNDTTVSNNPPQPPSHTPRLVHEVREVQDEARRFINNPHLVTGKAQYRQQNDAISSVERQEAYSREKNNWVDNHAFMEVDAATIRNSGKNVIGSHVIYRRKADGSIKARIVPWGHRDAEKHSMRCDAPTMNVDAFRLIFSLAAERGWTLGQMDVKAAFLQAKGFHRELYVRPPREEDTRKLWRLTAAAYGLCDSGRLWYLTSDSALTNDFGLSKSRTENALYFKRDDVGNLCFVLATQVDNYIYAGSSAAIRSFEIALQKEFDVGELDHHNFVVMGCTIKQLRNGTVIVTQPDRFRDISPENLRALAADRSGNDIAMPKDVTQYKSVIGQMLYVGRLTHPPLLYQASRMASKTPLQIHHLRDLASIVNTASKTPPKLVYPNISISNERQQLVAYADAAMGSKKDTGARGGYIIVRKFGDTVHPVAWSACKLKRVARSSATAELLAAANATSHLLYLQSLMRELIGGPALVEGCLMLDSNCLAKLATSTKEPEEALNKIDLASIRQSFHCTALGTIGWHPGAYHVADCLTKDNPTSCALMLKVLREGQYPMHPDAKLTLAEQSEHEKNSIDNSLFEDFEHGAEH